MNIKVQLEKHLPNLIGKPVNGGDGMIGKIIEYDEGSGIATFEMYNTPNKWWPITQSNYSLSSRKIE